MFMKKININGKCISLKRTREVILCAVYFMLYPLYYEIAIRYAYMGYLQNDGIQPVRFIGMFLVAFFFICYGNVLKNHFLKSAYDIFLVLFLFNELCLYTCMIDADLTMIIIISTFLLLFKILDKVDITLPYVKTSLKSWFILFLLSIILFLPFLRYLDIVNIRNLFLEDVYETRALFNAISMPRIMGYIMEPLSRVIFPVLIIKFLKEKKKIYAIICGIMIIFLFLCGALKSIFFGLIAVILFYGGSMLSKGKRFNIGVLGAEFVAFVMAIIFNNNTLISILRRIFFVPARFNKYYIDYFRGNYTYYMHSGFSPFSSSFLGGSEISKYVGKFVIKNGTNANTGIFVEGYYSFGLIGAVLYLIVPLFILLYLKSLNYKPDYFGIVFVYIYYFNTSILSTLLMSHGLAVFLIVALVFLRENEFG